MFSPVNRYILINMPAKREETQSIIVLPEDYRVEEERFIEVETVAAATDVRFELSHLPRLVVDGSMIEEITIGGTIYNVILDNYVIATIE